jgi:hypothetical protein
VPRDPALDWWLKNRGSIDDAVDRDIDRSCTSKDGYDSESAARAHAAMNGMSGKLFSYECRYCRLWHLTRRPTAPHPSTDG